MRGRSRILIALVAAVAMVGAVNSGPPALASNYLGAHWAHDGLAHSQIYFVDHTGSRWPVSTVTYKWNQAVGVDSYYETSCPGRRLHCVNVYEYSAADGNLGVTYYNIGSHQHFTFAEVDLNDHYHRGATADHHTTCQELGHALGLAHQYTSNTCMNDHILNTVYPNSHDFSELESIYDHTN